MTDNSGETTGSETYGLGSVSNSETLSGESGVVVPESTSEASEGDKPMSKEMRYRLERNAAREEVSAAEARIEKLQRAHIENLSKEVLANPSDIFVLSEKTVADYLDEDGYVVAQMVLDDIKEIVANRPLLRRPDRATDPTQGTGGQPKNHQPSWGSLFLN